MPIRKIRFTGNQHRQFPIQKKNLKHTRALIALNLFLKVSGIIYPSFLLLFLSVIIFLLADRSPFIHLTGLKDTLLASVLMLFSNLINEATLDWIYLTALPMKNLRVSLPAIIFLVITEQQIWFYAHLVN